MSKKKTKKIRKAQNPKLSSTEPELQKLASEKTAAIASYIEDPDYRLRCKAAIDILMAKLKMINAELSGQKKRAVISQITSRIKDYIKNPKKNGYKSLHLIVKVPIYSTEGEQKELVEIQLRTIAMDYWSVLEYELYYKKRDNAEIETELKEYAEEIANLDHRMLKLRNKIEKIGYKETR